MINKLAILKIGMSGKIRRFSKNMKECLDLASFSKKIESSLSKKEIQEIEESVKSESGLFNSSINYFDKNYPDMLSRISSPPFMLFCDGDISLLNTPCIAIVGSRECSDYGEKYTDIIVKILVEKGYTIVSGLARGIDSHAHKAALKYGGKTIAVLGWGIAFRKLPIHQLKLLKKISENSLIISEFLPSEQASKFTFPVRNRIISGLSVATIIMEARKKSGSLITANYAFKQRRDLFVIPGRLDDENSSGCLSLVHENKARIISDIEDFSHELPDMAIRKKEKQNTEPVTNIYLTEYETKIINFIRINSPCEYDFLLREGGINTGELSRILLQLQMKGLIKKLPGNKFKVG